MLDLIRDFEIEVDKAYCESNSMTQLNELSRVSSKISTFCRKDIKPVDPESPILDAIISSINNSVKENLVSKYHKNENIKRQLHYDKMENHRCELETSLRMIKSYIAEGKIIKGDT